MANINTALFRLHLERHDFIGVVEVLEPGLTQVQLAPGPTPYHRTFENQRNKWNPVSPQILNADSGFLYPDRLKSNP